MPPVNYTSTEDDAFSAYPLCGHHKIHPTVTAGSSEAVSGKAKKVREAVEWKPCSPVTHQKHKIPEQERQSVQW